MITIGHRGCAGLEPENTLLGFRRAIALGVDFIELDIRLTKDRQLVVIHDGTLDRTTNMKGLVSDYTYLELKKADAGKKENLPLLFDVFSLVENSAVKIQVELKEPGMAELLTAAVAGAHMTEKVHVISFWHRELVKVKKLNCLLQAGVLTVSNPAGVQNLFKDTLADFISIVHDMADQVLVEEVHRINKKIYVWGKIDSRQKVDRLTALGVDGIASDYPDLVVARLEELGKSK